WTELTKRSGSGALGRAGRRRLRQPCGWPRGPLTARFASANLPRDLPDPNPGTDERAGTTAPHGSTGGRACPGAHGPRDRGAERGYAEPRAPWDPTAAHP